MSSNSPHSVLLRDIFGAFAMLEERLGDFSTQRSEHFAARPVAQGKSKPASFKKGI